MPYCSIRGVDHYYEWICESGSEPFGSRPVLVFLHGWAGSARYWESTARRLMSQYDCLLYDLRGFGRSHLPRPIPETVAAIGYELETYADDLALLLDEFGLERVTLNAHSTGASIAVFFLNQYAERVNRAILTCSGIFEYNQQAFEAFYRFGKYVVDFRPGWLRHIPLVDQLFMARFLRRSIPAGDRRAFLADYLDADYEAALGTIYTAVSKKAVDVMPQEFARLTVPTLLISGEYDQIIPASMGQQAASLSDRITHCVIAETGHFPMLEDAATYMATIEAFLNQTREPVA
ncbi:alpha/beta hydrolase [Thermoleptolyngbya sichuanensis A183]|uniref:Alpha/beta hydrolase n=1 Tax=Thermoleptolyngbya sichuanensis A183 TaxID=2737172 RepID=A0A6M8B5H2_9CYAN|nr:MULTISPECIES: alpha/beta hydrolase [Thermoleptolyngbya]QKD82194.1 alpha/beta hydrolase [Thermoleptolyngbya sichuanensis A183]